MVIIINNNIIIMVGGRTSGLGESMGAGMNIWRSLQGHVMSSGVYKDAMMHARRG
jgi:hypothetical protein